MECVKKVKSWEVPVNRPMEEQLERVAHKVIERYGVTIENGVNGRCLCKQEMLEGL